MFVGVRNESDELIVLKMIAEIPIYFASVNMLQRIGFGQLHISWLYIRIIFLSAKLA